jgi:two-component system phosphate regulon response regulator PhoB
MTALSQLQRVLIVDDDPACRALLEAIFETHGYGVTATDSVIGASALITQSRPDVIMLDLALPYRSGASWLAQLKANPATVGIPVIILSALSDVMPKERRELAQAVIQKPFRTSALLETVRALCVRTQVVDVTLRRDSASSQLLGRL